MGAYVLFRPSWLEIPVALSWSIFSQIEWRQADSAPLWTRAAVRPIFDEHGRVVATRSTHVDITDRKRAEEALRLSEERLARILDSAMDAILTFDARRCIDQLSESYRTVLLLRDIEELAETWSQIVSY